MAAAFASCDEDDVALAGIDILILKNEKLINAVLLKRGDLDNYADWPNEASVEDNVLLAANLKWR